MQRPKSNRYCVQNKLSEKNTAKQLLFYSHFEYDFRVTDKYE